MIPGSIILDYLDGLGNPSYGNESRTLLEFSKKKPDLAVIPVPEG
jgi:hypothetical protein